MQTTTIKTIQPQLQHYNQHRFTCCLKRSVAWCRRVPFLNVSCSKLASKSCDSPSTIAFSACCYTRPSLATRSDYAKHHRFRLLTMTMASLPDLTGRSGQMTSAVTLPTSHTFARALFRVVALARQPVWVQDALVLPCTNTLAAARASVCDDTPTPETALR